MAASSARSMLSLKWASTCSRTRRMAAPTRSAALGRGHQRKPCIVAAGDDELRRNIRGILAPKETGVSFEYAPQADPASEPVIIEQQGGARGPACADDALVVIQGHQHPRGALFWRCHRDDPSLAEALSENRPSMARAEFAVSAPVSACARSDRSGSNAETSNTAIRLPSTPRTGAAEQLRSVCRDRKSWFQ